MTSAERRRALLRAPYRRRMIGGVLLALVVGFSAWYLGVDTAHALGIGGVVLAVLVCTTAVGEQARADRAPEPPSIRNGSRREVVQLGWALHTRGGTVAPEAIRRLRAVTAQTLELRGLDLDSASDRPEIERLLGADVLSMLRRGSAELPRRAVYASVLDRLDRLAQPAAVTPADPSGSHAAAQQATMTTTGGEHG